jgi:glycerate 2-kinase
MTHDAGTKLEEIHSAAQSMFLHALEACEVGKAFDRHLHFEGMTLIRHPSAALKPVSIPLDRYKKVFVIAFGKAAMTMLDALLARLPKKIHIRGVCCAPRLPKKRNWRIRYFTGGHPLPNEDSLAAAEATLKLLKRARRDTFIFFLISGGGSAMLELPRNPKISLDDTIAFHETLVASGASITEINTVRRYFSAVKGGRLALAAPEAEKLSLLIADVPLKDLGCIVAYAARSIDAGTMPRDSRPLSSSRKIPLRCARIFRITLAGHRSRNAWRKRERSLQAHTIRYRTIESRLRECCPRSRSRTRLSRRDRQHLRRLGLR